MANPHLGTLTGELDAALAELDRGRIVERIWAQDSTVWNPDPAEISNRLGWLDLVAAPPRSDADIRDLVTAVMALRGMDFSLERNAFKDSVRVNPQRGWQILQHQRCGTRQPRASPGPYTQIRPMDCLS